MAVFNLAAPSGARIKLPNNRLNANRGLSASRRVALGNRPLQIVVGSSVADFQATETAEEAILCAKIPGHTASVAAITIIDEGPCKKIVTTSLDKSVALWTSVDGACDVLCNSGYEETQRFTSPGGPVFSLLVDKRSDDGMPDQILLGTHGKQVLAWVPPQPQLDAGVVLEGHCGWVRALESSGKRWLYSVGCKTIHIWDMARAVPKSLGTVDVEKGDILAMAASKARLFTAGSDGSIRSFAIDAKTGGLTPAACRPKAHGDRVSAVVLEGDLLFSSSYDGTIKVWDATTLEIVNALPAAHAGERVNCLALGPNKMLYSGGGDCMVRRWSMGLLVEAAPPLHAHSHSVGALAAGKSTMLVSGDNAGEVAVWKVGSGMECGSASRSMCW